MSNKFLKSNSSKSTKPKTSRREFLTITGSSIAALSSLASGSVAAGDHINSGSDAVKATMNELKLSGPRPPFDSIRDYMAALEANGLLIRVPRIDQDRYHSTAMVFRSADRFGLFNAPALLFEQIKIDGVWMDGPVIANTQGHINTDSILAGIDPVPEDRFVSYRKAKAHWTKMLDSNNDSFPEIPPVEIASNQAPCKEVTLTGDDINLLDFPFIKTNPADAGRYINTGSVFTYDDRLGHNFGTYRCEITGPRSLSVNSSPNHVGYKTWMAARERGEKTAKVSIVVGQDPIVWMVSGAPLARRREEPVNELAIAGGLRGKALEVVKSETNDLLVPAHSEMVIEGEILVQDELVTEGPFGEMFGYLGVQKENVFTMRINTITHRKNPWIMNSYTGMTRGYITAPMESLYDKLLRNMVPNLVEFHYPQTMKGVSFISIDKTAPGQGLEAGRKIAGRIPISKVVVVVDKEMNILDPVEMWFTIGSRWQPYTASEIIKEAPGIITDPSAPKEWKSSKIVIDATKQWPEEGGPKDYAELNRVLLEKGAPNAFREFDADFSALLQNWEQV
ncbi:MAG: UbiD family decarboxylase [Pseudomonadota bacterium]|nr:UbiD family decarboxylase [Pseudomonadota bacterium]